MPHIYGNRSEGGPAVKNLFIVTVEGADFLSVKAIGNLETADNTIRYHTATGDEYSYPNGTILTEFTVSVTDPFDVMRFNAFKVLKQKVQITISKLDANKRIVKTWEFEECNVQKITDDDNDAEIVDQLESTTIAIIGRCVDIVVS